MAPLGRKFELFQGKKKEILNSFAHLFWRANIACIISIGKDRVTDVNVVLWH